MDQYSTSNACRMCGATNYRRVIARDESGAMRSTGLYHCSGCSVVFTDPRAWRGGDRQDLGSGTQGVTPLTPVRLS
jgi:hypothetical protein